MSPGRNSELRAILEKARRRSEKKKREEEEQQVHGVIFTMMMTMMVILMMLKISKTNRTLAAGTADQGCYGYDTDC